MNREAPLFRAGSRHRRSLSPRGETPDNKGIRAVRATLRGFPAARGILTGAYGLPLKGGSEMEVYLVGGVLRDALLSRPSKDVDLLLRGVSAEALTQEWGLPTGQAFPVWRVGPFEVALPRREKKVGVGYKGFEVQVDGHLPLEVELGRRDFTVNALALRIWEGEAIPSRETLEGVVECALSRGFRREEILNPFGGLEDLEAGVLRAPYPEAFRDDPVRVLRAARFASRYGWRVDPATLEAARQGAHELAHEPAERIWAEWEKAVAHDPARFLEVLAEADALRHIRGLEWLERARGLEIKNHQEDLFAHSLLVVKKARELVGPDLGGVTAALFHDAGKAWGIHPHDGPEAAAAVEAALRSLRAPSQVLRQTTVWLRHHMAIFGAKRAGAVLDLALALHKAGITPGMAAGLALADSLGRLRVRPDAEARADALRSRLELALQVVGEVGAEALLARGVQPGPAFGEALRSLRANRLAQVMT